MNVHIEIGSINDHGEKYHAEQSSCRVIATERTKERLGKASGRKGACGGTPRTAGTGHACHHALRHHAAQRSGRVGSSSVTGTETALGHHGRGVFFVDKIIGV